MPEGHTFHGGHIATVEMPPEVDRAKIDPSENRSVDKQDRCRACGTEVPRWTLANRSAYACDTCQPAR